MVVFFLGSQGATLKFYLEGAKTIQVFLGEDLAWALTDCCFDFVTSWFFFGLPRCHFEVLPGRCQDDPGLSWGRSGLNLIAAFTFHDVVQ